MNTPALHVVIISWQGQAHSARVIADALAPVVDGGTDGGMDGRALRLSVIYSNTDETPETGPGTWHRVPQSWYFGRKFARALDLLAPDEVMLQIQADVSHDDWPGLVRDCQASFARYDRMGIWASELSWTPWPTDRVRDGAPLSPDLHKVIQSDGVVWALHPRIWQPMAALDYDVANLGWGIDWLAGHLARRQNRYTVRDSRHRVDHPKERGYSGAVAAQHMKNLLAQLSLADRTEILARHDALHATLSGPDPAVPSVPPVSPSFSRKLPIMSQSSSSAPKALVWTSLFEGRVYLGASAPLKNPVLASGSDQVGFEKRSHPVDSTIAPLAISLAPDAAPAGVTVQHNGLGEWQVAQWSTLQVIPDVDTPSMVIPLGAPLSIDAERGEATLQVALAQHRARGLLRVHVQDTRTKTVQTRDVRFQAGREGGATPGGYQVEQIALGRIAAPVTVRLDLVYEGSSSTTHEPPVFFVAQPQVVVAETQTPTQAQIQHLSTDTGAASVWYEATLTKSMAQAPHRVTVQSGGAAVPVLEAQDVGLTCVEDWGHAFQFEGSMAMPVAVYINGTPAFASDINQGTTYLHLPLEELSGRHSWMEIRDRTGSRILWSGWILPRWQVTPTETLQTEGKSPYPAEVFHQSPYRFQALRDHLAQGASQKVLAQLPAALTALEDGHDALTMTPLAFPAVKNPDVSVIIPAHNKVKVTYACLASLLLAPNTASFEVILVDDASTDETAQIEKIVSGIKVVRNAESQRFIRACNAGVAASRGRFVTLLNNDTEVTSGWLDALVEAFDRFDNVGLVGSKLLYPDGKLQDAGGVIWGTGDPWNYGNRQNPWDPRFSYARQADYLSGAAMMTTRAIWDQLGGLSTYLEPMYFEDTDFAFKVRDAGYTTWFVPGSIVYHYEGMTSGTDTSSGFKRFQEVNRPKFKRKWAQDFASFTKTASLAQVDLEKDRGILGRVLFIDYTTPTPDMDAGSYAAIQEIKLVQSLGYKVTFLPENLAYFAGYTQEMNAMGVEVITAPFYTSLDHFIRARGAEFDAVYITRYHVANATVPVIREVNPQARIIMNNADLHYLRLLRKAVANADETQKQEARAVQAEEFQAMQSVDLVLSYNDKEHAIIEAQSEGAISVMTCPWVLECPDTVPPLEGRDGLSFLGGFRHYPNVEGVEWFVRNVMNRLEGNRSDIRLSIYGSRMPAPIKAMASDVIDPVGFVEEVAQAYDRHRIFVAPLLSGAGIKGKVLSALAHGIPPVLSPMAAEGIGVRHGHDCMIASTGSEWVDAITALYDDDALWTKMSQAGRDLAASQFSFAQGRIHMRKAFEAIELFNHLA